MRRVVVTGMGIVCSIGNNTQEVVASLARSQVRHRRRPKTTSAWASAAKSTAA